MPAAFVTYKLRNRGRRQLAVQFSFNAQYPTPGDLHGQNASDLVGHEVRHRREEGAAGLYFDSDVPADDAGKVSIAVVSPRVVRCADDADQ